MHGSGIADMSKQTGPQNALNGEALIAVIPLQIKAFLGPAKKS